MKAVFVSIVVVLLLTLFVVAAEAQGPYPEWVEVFTVNGETYILAAGSITHVCPCDCRQTYTPDPKNPTEEPTVEPTEEPTVQPTVQPTDSPTVEPTEEPKCNRGRGNGAENCDPGNSEVSPETAARTTSRQPNIKTETGPHGPVCFAAPS